MDSNYITQRVLIALNVKRDEVENSCNSCLTCAWIVQMLRISATRSPQDDTCIPTIHEDER